MYYFHFIFFKVSNDLVPEPIVPFERVMLLCCRFICNIFKDFSLLPHLCRKVKLRNLKYYKVFLALLLCLMGLQFSLNIPFFILWGKLFCFSFFSYVLSLHFNLMAFSICLHIHNSISPHTWHSTFHSVCNSFPNFYCAFPMLSHGSKGKFL